MFFNIFRSEKKRSSLLDKNKPKEEVLPHDKVTPRDAIQPSAEQELIQSITTFRKNMQCINGKLKSEHARTIKMARKDIINAEKFIKATGVNRSLLLMLKEMRSWPGKIHRDNLEERNVFDVFQIQCEKKRDHQNDNYFVEFVSNGESFRFEFDLGSSIAYDTYLGEVRLYHDDHLVISFSITQSLETEAEWIYAYANSLKVGPWVGHIVEIEEKFNTSKTKAYYEDSAQKILKKAKKMPGGMKLDADDSDTDGCDYIEPHLY